MHSEEPGREPPLDRATNRRTAAPTVGVAATLAVAGIMHTLDQAPAHSSESRSPHTGAKAPLARTSRHAGDWTCGHLLSTLGPSHSVLDGYPEIGNEGESLTTPSESVVSGPTPYLSQVPRSRPEDSGSNPPSCMSCLRSTNHSTRPITPHAGVHRGPREEWPGQWFAATRENHQGLGFHRAPRQLEPAEFEQYVRSDYRS
jgi:hypothetical protein